MVWPSERNQGATLPFNPLPKLLVFTGNYSYGGTPAYEHQVCFHMMLRVFPCMPALQRYEFLDNFTGPRSIPADT